MVRITRGIIPGAAALTCAILIAGCAEIQQNLEGIPGEIQSGVDDTRERHEARQERTSSRETESQEESSAPVTSPVRISLDGAKDEPADQFGIYWDTERRVSANPNFVLAIDSELGDFQRLMINLYEADDEGKEKGSPWAITDHGAEQILVPGRPISLTNPGDITIISPEGERIDSFTLSSGKTYICLFVVMGSEKAHTHKVRFTVR